MFGIVGIIVSVGAVLGGAIMAGVHLHVLWQPNEIVVIFGAALGGFFIANPLPVIKAAIKMLIHALTGGGPNKKDYLELMQMMFVFFQALRKDGPQGVEQHVEKPKDSAIFKGFPGFLKRHHAVDFFCDTMKITLSADLSQYDVDDLLDSDIKVMHEEEHQAVHAIASVADAMPGLGIVAAVLGVVHTMGILDQGTEAIGGAVAAALVGTFMGVLACYGIVGPIASKMAKDVEADGRYLRVIKSGLVALQRGSPPLVCVESARRTIYPTERPSFEEMDTALKNAKKAA